MLLKDLRKQFEDYLNKVVDEDTIIPIGLKNPYSQWGEVGFEPDESTRLGNSLDAIEEAEKSYGFYCRVWLGSSDSETPQKLDSIIVKYMLGDY